MYLMEENNDSWKLTKVNQYENTIWNLHFCELMIFPSSKERIAINLENKKWNVIKIKIPKKEYKSKT